MYTKLNKMNYPVEVLSASIPSPITGSYSSTSNNEMKPFEEKPKLVIKRIDVKVEIPLPYPFKPIKNVAPDKLLKGEFYLIGANDIAEIIKSLDINEVNNPHYIANLYTFSEQRDLTLCFEGLQWYTNFSNPLLLKRDFSTTRLVNYKKIFTGIFLTLATTLILSLFNKKSENN